MENPNAESAETNIEHNESLKQEIERSLKITDRTAKRSDLLFLWDRC